VGLKIVFDYFCITPGVLIGMNNYLMVFVLQFGDFGWRRAPAGHYEPHSRRLRATGASLRLRSLETRPRPEHRHSQIDPPHARQVQGGLPVGFLIFFFGLKVFNELLFI